MVLGLVAAKRSSRTASAQTVSRRRTARSDRAPRYVRAVLHGAAASTARVAVVSAGHHGVSAARLAVASAQREPRSSQPAKLGGIAAAVGSHLAQSPTEWGAKQRALPSDFGFGARFSKCYAGF